MAWKTNALNNMSFHHVFLHFLLWTAVLSVNLGAEHWNLELFWWTKTVLNTEILSFSGERKTKFEWTRKTQDFSVKHSRVNQNNSRFQCEAPRWTDKIESEQPKMHENMMKTQVVKCICFPRQAINFVGRKWLQGGFSGRGWNEIYTAADTVLVPK